MDLRCIHPGAAVLTVVAAVVVAVASSGLYLREHAEFVDDAYPRPTEPTALMSVAERAFFEEVAGATAPGSVVAQNPWSGSSLLWPLTGREVLFPHLVGEWTADQRYLALHLRDVSNDPGVCPAAARLGVRYLLVGTPDFWSGDGRARGFPGLDVPAPDSGFRLLEADGDGNSLYELTGCGAEVSS